MDTELSSMMRMQSCSAKEGHHGVGAQAGNDARCFQRPLTGSLAGKNYESARKGSDQNLKFTKVALRRATLVKNNLKNTV